MTAMMFHIAALIIPSAVAQVPCSMSGDLVGGRCHCDPVFTGDNCSALSFVPVAARQAGLNRNFEGGYQMTWGGSPIRAPDGKYHLFFSWFKGPDGKPVSSIKEWYHTSVVAHAVSDSAGENYVFQDVVLPPRGLEYFDGSTTHNPTVMQLPDGSYAIFYIGLNCHNYTGKACILHQWIGAAHSKSLDGPWDRPKTPALTGVGGWEGGMVANPGVVPLANGTLLMAYRGLGDRGIGMAASPSWDVPFSRLNGGAAVLGPESPSKTAVDEDMSIWRTERGIQMILHQEGRGSSVGAHAYSLDDGLSWHLAGNAYSLIVQNRDGTNSTYTRRERPQFLKDSTGQPLWMFSGVQDANGTTHTIAVELGDPSVKATWV